MGSDCIAYVWWGMGLLAGQRRHLLRLGGRAWGLGLDLWPRAVGLRALGVGG